MPLVSLDDFRKIRQQDPQASLTLETPFDFETPVSLFSRWKNQKYAFLLESVEGGEQWGRYSFIGLFPSSVLRCRGSEVEILTGRQKKKFSASNPLEALRRFVGPSNQVSHQKTPLLRGAIGYVSYDAVRFFERLPGQLAPDPVLPEFCFMKPEVLLVHDRRNHNLQIHFFPSPELPDREAYRRGRLAIRKILKEIQKRPQGITLSDGGKLSWKASLLQDEFRKKVERIKEYILAGDVTQTVFSIRFSTRGKTDPFAVYRRLRRINPSPYLFYLKLGEQQIVGASPETMVRLEERKMTLRPIAGTRPRGKTRSEDLQLEKELLADPKERAEHIMLVDLGRNDLGRVARPGSLRVDELMTIERYSHVMHIVSNLSAELQEEKDAFDLLRAAFPAGTLTGSPKVRAMEIIEELEPVRRGIYGGCVGYFSTTGNMDMAITIRSAFFYKGKVYVQAGAGIVADSDPEKEYQECLNKAKGMMEAIEG